MAMHYDPSLRYWLPANNNGGVVLNRAFRKWEDCIATNLRTREPTGGERYEEGEDARLLSLCREHAAAYQRPAEGRNTVMLTHPFYLHLSHRDRLDKAQEREADVYLGNLLGFLRLDRRGRQQL